MLERRNNGRVSCFIRGCEIAVSDEFFFGKVGNSTFAGAAEGNSADATGTAEYGMYRRPRSRTIPAFRAPAFYAPDVVRDRRRRYPADNGTTDFNHKPDEEEERKNRKADIFSVLQIRLSLGATVGE